MGEPINEREKVKFGNKLKEAREKKDLSQIQVARKAGMHVNYYARIERGDATANPSFNTLIKITKVLGLELLS